MNTLSIKTIPVSDKYENECIMIDDIPLHEYLIKWYQENGWGEIPQPIAPVDDLAFAWNTENIITRVTQCLWNFFLNWIR